MAHFSEDASLVKVFSDKKDVLRKLAATFYDKVGSSTQLQTRNGNLRKKSYMGSGQLICKGSKK